MSRNIFGQIFILLFSETKEVSSLSYNENLGELMLAIDPDGLINYRWPPGETPFDPEFFQQNPARPGQEEELKKIQELQKKQQEQEEEEIAKFKNPKKIRHTLTGTQSTGGGHHRKGSHVSSEATGIFTPTMGSHGMRKKEKKSFLISKVLKILIFFVVFSLPPLSTYGASNAGAGSLLPASPDSELPIEFDRLESDAISHKESNTIKKSRSGKDSVSALAESPRKHFQHPQALGRGSAGGRQRRGSSINWAKSVHTLFKQANGTNVKKIKKKLSKNVFIILLFFCFCVFTS